MKENENAYGKTFTGDELNDETREAILNQIPEYLQGAYVRVLDRINDHQTNEQATYFSVLEDVLVNLSVDSSVLANQVTFEYTMAKTEGKATSIDPEYMNEVMNSCGSKAQSIANAVMNPKISQSPSEGVLISILAAKSLLENIMAELQNMTESEEDVKQGLHLVEDV